jgi:hypothetical protein
MKRIVRSVIAPGVGWPYRAGTAPAPSTSVFYSHLHNDLQCQIFNFLKDNPLSSAELLRIKLYKNSRGTIHVGLRTLFQEGFVIYEMHRPINGSKSIPYYRLAHQIIS